VDCENAERLGFMVIFMLVGSGISRSRLPGIQARYRPQFEKSVTESGGLIVWQLIKKWRNYTPLLC
jgi:hypothetical protein